MDRYGHDAPTLSRGRSLAGLVVGCLIASTGLSSAQSPMAFASELSCSGIPARFGVVDDVPTFEIGGRRRPLYDAGRRGSGTLYRSRDGRLSFLARGRSGTLRHADGRVLRCVAAGGRRAIMQSQRGGTDTVEGGWRVKSIDGTPVPEGVTVTMEFARDGRVSGRSGCNLYMGSYEMAGGRMSLSGIAGTRMACPPPQDDVERRFLASVAAVDGVTLSERMELVLAGRGRPLIVMDRTR